MWYFFRQAKELQINDSQLGVETYFRDQLLSGLIEKRLDNASRAVMIFAGGKPAGAYALKDNSCKPISFADFTTLTTASTSDVRALKLPNRAMRLVWLSLESQVQDVLTVQVEETWRNQLKQWQDGKWNGLVEITCEAYHGFALYLDRGGPGNRHFLFERPGFYIRFLLLERISQPGTQAHHL